MTIYISELNTMEKLAPVLEEFKVGLEVVTFGNSCILEEREKHIEELKNGISRLNYKPQLSLHGPYADLSPGSKDTLIAAATLHRFNQAYQVAKELTCDRIIYHSGFLPKIYWEEQWVEKSIEFWRKFNSDKDNNISIHIENGFDEDYGYIKEIVDIVGEDKFSVCLDIGHVNVCSKNHINNWIRGLNLRIKHVHLHNNYGDVDSHRGLSKGNIDIHEVLELLSIYSPNANYTLEVFNTEELIKSINILKKDFLQLRE